MKVGLAVKPGTDGKVVDAWLDAADMVLVMTVEPGFGGQKFMADMMEKVRYLRKARPGLTPQIRWPRRQRNHLSARPRP